MNQIDNGLAERYKKYEIEDELNSEIKDLKNEIKRLKKENKHLKSTKAYKVWKKYAGLKNEDVDYGKRSRVPNLKDIKVALISDQFTYDSYKYEFEVISLNPKTWKKQFIREKPDLFFCESTWYGHNYKGNDAPWEGKIIKLMKADEENRTILLEILEFCKSNGIPTVFWNKEDPPHYRDEVQSFAETAKEFDYIFTSSKECLKQYKKDFNHPHVNVLMFAGQPKMFNPLNLTNESIDEIVFAGAYYHNFPERLKLMDDIFDRIIASGHRLLIYDRHYYYDWNAFPDRYSEYIRPAIPFDQIPEIYKKMKWGLNFNTVTESESMFARRIYELALSNVNIITNYSLAVEKLFGDNVFVFDRRDDLPDFDKDYEEQRMNNLYNVLENHTYTARWKQILDTIGFEYVDDKKDVSVIFKLSNPNELESIVNRFNSMDYDSKVLKILIDGEFELDADAAMEKYHVIDSISFKRKDLKIKTEYFIIADENVDADFIKKAILHYQYLNKRISICKGDDKFRLDVEDTIDGKLINKVNKSLISASNLEIEVYYI